MKNSKLFSLFVLALCCVFFFGIVARPIVAQASATATAVIIGSYGVSAVVITPYVLVGLIVGSFIGFMLTPLLDEVADWYNSDVVIRNWADQYNGVITGGEIVSLPPEVQEAIRAKYDVGLSVDLSTLYVPYDLMHLEKVSAVHVFGTDVAAQLEANNSLLLDIKDALTSLKMSVVNLASNIDNVRVALIQKLDFVATNVDIVRQTIMEQGHYIATNVDNLRLTLMNMENWVATNVDIVRQTIMEQGNYIATNVDIVRQTVLEQVDRVATNVDKVRLKVSEMSGYLGKLLDDIRLILIGRFNTLTSSVDSLIDRLENGLNVVIKDTVQVQDQVQTNLQKYENDIRNQTDAGKTQIGVFIGRGLDLLSRYSAPFLAVSAILTKFLSVHYMEDFVTFSLALGIFALLVNIGNTLSSAHRDSSAKGQKTRSSKAKGG